MSKRRRRRPADSPPQLAPRAALYQVSILPDAVSALQHFPKPQRANIAAKIDRLSNEPRPQMAIPLHGEKGGWRLRVGDYRILYRINDEAHSVTIVTIGHRKDVYRRK